MLFSVHGRAHGHLLLIKLDGVRCARPRPPFTMVMGHLLLPFLQTAMRGMTGSGDGVHVLTGPIFVETAEPGDVLKVEILKLYPRLNPQGETYGVNVSVTVDPQCCFSCSDFVLWTRGPYASFARRGSRHVCGCL